jgi:hypothetical protein
LYNIFVFLQLKHRFHQDDLFMYIMTLWDIKVYISGYNSVVNMPLKLSIFHVSNAEQISSYVEILKIYSKSCKTDVLQRVQRGYSFSVSPR